MIKTTAGMSVPPTVPRVGPDALTQKVTTHRVVRVRSLAIKAMSVVQQNTQDARVGNGMCPDHVMVRSCIRKHPPRVEIRFTAMFIQDHFVIGPTVF